MAVGDVFSGLSSVASNSYLVIQPASGVEAVVHNIYHASDAQLELYDGTNSLVFDVHYGAGGWLGFFFHVTNSRYLRVKNLSSSSALIGYDGIVTKSS